MATTEGDNKELVRGFVNDILVEGNFDRIDEYLAVDYVEHTQAVPEPIAGREEIREYYAGMRSAFPDLDVTIQDLIAEGNKVVQRSRQGGTHEGVFMDFEPTGNTWEVPGIVIYRIEAGTIVESWAQADIVGMMEQLGIE